MYLRSNFGLAPKNSLTPKWDSDSQSLYAFRFGELKSSGRITVSVRCTLRPCLHMLGWGGGEETSWWEGETHLCVYARGRSGRYMRSCMHTVISTGRNSTAGRDVRLEAGILSWAIWITESKLPESGSCQCSRRPRSQMGMRSELLLVCAWQGSFRLQGTENPAETTKGVHWLTGPELAFSSFLSLRLAPFSAGVPRSPWWLPSVPRDPCLQQKRKACLLQVPANTRGSLSLDWVRSLFTFRVQECHATMGLGLAYEPLLGWSLRPGFRMLRLD